jgi:beta propeller repeat protein
LLVYSDKGATNLNIFSYPIGTEVSSFGALAQLTSDVSDQVQPVVSGTNVVWEDFRNGFSNPDLYGVSLLGGGEFAVDTNPAAQEDPAISGNVVVWQDERNGTPNIFAMDLSNLGTEIPVASGSNLDAESPAIDGSRIVFSEKVNGYYQVFLYDLSTGTTRQLSPSPSNETHPKISGNRVIWQDDRNQATSGLDIYGFDLSTNTTFPVDTEPGDQTQADIGGNGVVFADNRYGNQDIFLLFLSASDTTPPTISLTTPAEGAAYTLNQRVNASYSCQDDSGGSGLASCSGTVPNGSALDTSSVGTKAFTVNAADNAGNTNSVTHHYTVGYAFSGFIAPVNNPDTVNTGKSGKTYPVRWQLRDATGAYISALSAIRSITYKATTCGAYTGDPTDALETSTTGSSGLRYDATANQYVYNWATPSKGCYTLFVTLDSGQIFPAYFNLS